MLQSFNNRKFTQRGIIAGLMLSCLLPALTAYSAEESLCKLTIDLQDDFSQEPVAGLVRVTRLDTNRLVTFPGNYHRGRHWYSIPGKTALKVPATRLRVEALQGLESERIESVIDLTNQQVANVALPIRNFYEAGIQGWASGNPLLQLVTTPEAAERYLAVVLPSDRLDMVFLSGSPKSVDSTDATGSRVAINRLSESAQQTLNDHDIQVGFGIACEHTDQQSGTAYGHVVLLGNHSQLAKMVELPAAGQRPLQPMLQAAKSQSTSSQATTIVCCREGAGLERTPNWIAGLIDSQSIYDGQTPDRYEDTFYPYLNVGIHVPFSTGTNWLINDFARTYVWMDPGGGPNDWLTALRKGRSYITNGPLLELETEQAEIGDSLTLESSNRITVVGRGFGRLDFGGLELVYNGEVVHRVAATREGGYHFADLRHGLQIDRSGWFALRIPPQNNQNELGHPLFAHTSPIYVQVAGKPTFDKASSQALIDEMERNILKIQNTVQFSSDDQRDNLLSVYRSAVETLKQKSQ